MSDIQLNLFDTMDYYPSQQKAAEKASALPEAPELLPIIRSDNDYLDYPAAREEILKIIGKEIKTVCGHGKHASGHWRWFFNLEPVGFCFIEDTCALYEQIPGEKKPIYRGKVHKEVFIKIGTA
ncbi:hypothetical protein [Listeria ilorinensis]|uniref:hypothetical protein n=1 Tax=Listeria ilorinensis TaxID=2867439 RepID=UPI001EF5C5B6|nr:hypothetical protein [Listeria ilorinensis]